MTVGATPPTTRFQRWLIWHTQLTPRTPHSKQPDSAPTTHLELISPVVNIKQAVKKHRHMHLSGHCWRFITLTLKRHRLLCCTGARQQQQQQQRQQQLWQLHARFPLLVLLRLRAAQ
jgi:hypothetical protein